MAIITNVSVISTDSTVGIDSIIWLTPTELDTTQYLGPYRYDIFDGNEILIKQLSTKNFLYELETSYNIKNINTTDTTRNYKIGLFYNYLNVDTIVGFSSSASSIHLRTIPNDNQIELFWSENIPWDNEKYYVYKSDSLDGIFQMIDSTNSPYYIDSGLINQKQYCYYIKSYGKYLDTLIFSPLINFSQKVCHSPFDYTPPCPPKLTIIGDCEEEINSLTWSNPNNDCSNDVVSYSMYFTPFLDGLFTLINTFNSENDTSFKHQNSYNGIPSVAGCYYVTATDSIIYSNESLPSDTVCFDNCPSFFLPNIFTPNNDNKNDYFQALVPIKYIEKIDLNIFNRWGAIVFESSNPNFKWDGHFQGTELDCPDGAYYFQCVISNIRLEGIEKIELNGHIQLLRDNTIINQ